MCGQSVVEMWQCLRVAGGTVLCSVMATAPRLGRWPRRPSGDVMVDAELVIGELSESLDAFDGRCEFSADLAADLGAERQAVREPSGFFARLGTLFGR